MTRFYPLLPHPAPMGGPGYYNLYLGQHGCIRYGRRFANKRGAKVSRTNRPCIGTVFIKG